LNDHFYYYYKDTAQCNYEKFVNRQIFDRHEVIDIGGLFSNNNINGR